MPFLEPGRQLDRAREVAQLIARQAPLGVQGTRRELLRVVSSPIAVTIGRVKLGLGLGYWGAGPNPSAMDLIREAESLGYDSLWTAEAYGSDALTPLAWYGSQTSSLKLGTAIIQMSARTPAATAMAAITLDHLSGGRFILGLGVSGPQVVEGWYGQTFAKPLARTREYVAIMRQVFARQGAR